MATMSPATASSIGLALQAAEGQQLGDPAALDLLAVARERLDRHAGGEAARFDAAGEQAAQEGVGLDQHGQHLRRLVGARLGLRRRHVRRRSGRTAARGSCASSARSITAQPCLPQA